VKEQSEHELFLTWRKDKRMQSPPQPE